MELRSGKRLKMIEGIPKKNDKTILMLNDDCLYLIFEYLDINDVVVAEEVCRRFKTVAEMRYPTWKIFNFEEILRRDWTRYNKLESYIRKILRRVSPYVHQLKFRDAYQFHTPCYAIQACLLKEIKKYTFNAVKVIDLETFVQITDEELMSMFRLDQIEVLNVESLDVKGTFLPNLKTIKEINVVFCRYLDWELFSAFCVANPQLTKLHFQINDRNLNSLQAIFKKLVNLESLHIYGYYSQIEISNEVQNALADLPKLTGLAIKGSYYSNFDVFFKKIFALNRLESLEIQFVDIYRFVDSITKLSHLKILKLNYLDEDNSQAVLTILERISCGAALQELYIRRCKNPHLYLKQFIARHPSIRYIDLLGCCFLDQNFIPEIADLVKDRNHVLKVVVEPNYYNTYLKDFCDGRNKSFKLIIGK